jgi:hypothetical protein
LWSLETNEYQARLRDGHAGEFFVWVTGGKGATSTVEGEVVMKAGGGTTPSSSI